MNRVGKRAARRAALAAPPALARSLPRGCAYALSGYVAAGLLLLYLSGHWLWFVVVAPALAIAVFWIGRRATELALLREVQDDWGSRGIRCLIVHSDSPVWREHIQARWLPRLEGVACTLNWSERASWQPTLAVRVFERFCGRNRNFNPSVVVFRGTDRPLVFRFFYAFQEAKKGVTEFVTALEREMFAAVGITDADVGPERAAQQGIGPDGRWLG